MCWADLNLNTSLFRHPSLNLIENQHIDSPHHKSIHNNGSSIKESLTVRSVQRFKVANSMVVKTTLKKPLPNITNSTNLFGPFSIPKIEEEWEHNWDQNKFECIHDGKRKDGDRKGSRKSLNPETYLFLKLAVDAVREVNQLTEKNGL